MIFIQLCGTSTDYYYYYHIIINIIITTIIITINIINPFEANVPILYALKTPENF